MTGSPGDPTPSSPQCAQATSRTGEARRPRGASQASVLDVAEHTALRAPPATHHHRFGDTVARCLLLSQRSMGCESHRAWSPTVASADRGSLYTTRIGPIALTPTADWMAFSIFDYI